MIIAAAGSSFWSPSAPQRWEHGLFTQLCDVVPFTMLIPEAWNMLKSLPVAGHFTHSLPGYESKSIDRSTATFQFLPKGNSFIDEGFDGKFNLSLSTTRVPPKCCLIAVQVPPQCHLSAIWVPWKSSSMAGISYIAQSKLSALSVTCTNSPLNQEELHVIFAFVHALLILFFYMGYGSAPKGGSAGSLRLKLMQKSCITL